MKTIEYEPPCGIDILVACHRACVMSRGTKMRVEFTFSTARLYATPKRCLPSLLWDWEVALSRMERDSMRVIGKSEQ